MESAGVTQEAKQKVSLVYFTLLFIDDLLMGHFIFQHAKVLPRLCTQPLKHSDAKLI